jgi:hypothetical protein
MSTPTVAVSALRRVAAEASAYVGAVVTALSPDGASKSARHPKKLGRQGGLYVRYASIWALRPPIVNSRAVICRRNRSKDRDAVYFGASTMVIWRPSIKGSASTLAIGAVSALTRCRSLKPIS